MAAPWIKCPPELENFWWLPIEESNYNVQPDEIEGISVDVKTGREIVKSATFSKGKLEVYAMFRNSPKDIHISFVSTVETWPLLQHIIRILSSSGCGEVSEKCFDRMFLFDLSQKNHLLEQITSEFNRIDGSLAKRKNSLSSPDYIGSVEQCIHFYVGIGINASSNQYTGYVALQYEGRRYLNPRLARLVSETECKMEKLMTTYKINS